MAREPVRVDFVFERLSVVVRPRSPLQRPEVSDAQRRGRRVEAAAERAGEQALHRRRLRVAEEGVKVARVDDEGVLQAREGARGGWG